MELNSIGYLWYFSGMEAIFFGIDRSKRGVVRWGNVKCDVLFRVILSLLDIYSLVKLEILVLVWDSPVYTRRSTTPMKRHREFMIGWQVAASGSVPGNQSRDFKSDSRRGLLNIGLASELADDEFGGCRRNR